jgi:hypothetical protein
VVWFLCGVVVQATVLFYVCGFDIGVLSDVITNINCIISVCYRQYIEVGVIVSVFLTLRWRASGVILFLTCYNALIIIDYYKLFNWL